MVGTSIPFRLIIHKVVVSRVLVYVKTSESESSPHFFVAPHAILSDALRTFGRFSNWRSAAPHAPEVVKSTRTSRDYQNTKYVC